MSGAIDFVVSYLALFVALGLLFRMLRAIKYQRAPARRAMTREDFLIAAMWSGVVTIATTIDRTLGLITVAGGSALFFALWLDAALFHVFTFELGAGGIGGVVISNLIAEVWKMRTARQFFVDNRLFAGAPLAALLLHVLPLCEPSSLLRLLIGALLIAYLIATLIPSAVRDKSLLRKISRRRSLLHDFVNPRRPEIPNDFQPRTEHSVLLAPGSSAFPPSRGRALLPGRSVVLLTFESLSSWHLSKQGGAHTPFFDSIAASRSVISSRQHVCLAPLTNAAHIALYFSDYGARKGQGSSALYALRRAGYTTAYLTAATVQHYGLGALLRQAGFRHILDGEQLIPHPRLGGGAVTDSALMSFGLRLMRNLLHGSKNPFFLHIHAANSHLPYRVDDVARFCRHDARDDRGRFLNSIEECDFIFGELWQTLRTLSPSGQDEDAPLLFISSDHGQAFGERGYFSHGSSITREELDVPLLIHHPRISPRELNFSTHFDVLPTILGLLGLLDLAPSAPGFGVPLCDVESSPAHLLWDGQPSRSTSHCLGLLHGDSKYSLDLIRDTCIVSRRDDEDPRELFGQERAYFEALIGSVARKRSIL